MHDDDALARMRRQYYFRPSPDGLLAWDVHRLVRLSRDLPVHAVPLSDVRELDEPVSGDDDGPLTWRGLVAHVRLMDEVDPRHPIILAADGAVMDGRHRVARALREGRPTIDAVRFAEDPPPDHVGRAPEELEY